MSNAVDVFLISVCLYVFIRVYTGLKIGTKFTQHSQLFKSCCLLAGGTKAFCLLLAAVAPLCFK